jgi:Zn-dependent peptidase ImmA (M78 family)
VADKLIKIMDAYIAAKRVDHYYWMHTNGDDHITQLISIENIQRIIEILCETSIEKIELNFEGQFHRAFVERFDKGKRNVIYVMGSEPEEWKRFSTVKELCHILIDCELDFQSNPSETIMGITGDTMPFNEHSPVEIDSEALAEIIAMELIYPLDHRRADRESLDGGSSVSTISKKRKVPEKYISLGTSDAHYESTLRIWKRLPPVQPPNLDEYLN